MPDPRTTAAEFAAAIAKVLGGRLDTVVLHGSVARGEAVPGVSDINLLVLLDRVDATVLRDLAPLARRWVDAGNDVPLLMATHEWKRAADAFAIEVADMRDAHLALRGSKPFADTEVEASALRLQAERELRGKLVQLRERLLLAADTPDDVGRLLLAALPSFTTYLRTLLRLERRAVPASTEDVIRSAAAILGADPGPMLQAWSARRDRFPLHAEIGDPIVAGYIALAERCAEHVDAHGNGEAV